MWVRTQPPTPLFITFYANLAKWTEGLTGWPGTVIMPGLELRPMCIGPSEPVSGHRLAIYCGGVVWDVEVDFVERTGVQQVNLK